MKKSVPILRAFDSATAAIVAQLLDENGIPHHVEPESFFFVQPFGHTGSVIWVLAENAPRAAELLQDFDGPHAALLQTPAENEQE